jgi:hypothetical protein
MSDQETGSQSDSSAPDLPAEQSAASAAERSAPERSAPPSWLSVALSQPLSRVQAVVGVLAGCLTIVGTLVSYTGLTKPSAPVLGELVAVVQESRSHRPLVHATVEIITPQDAIVTTLNPEPDGRVTRKLKEGQYRVRVTHPNLVTEIRHIEVHPGQRSELRVALVPRPAPRVVRTVSTTTVVEEPGAVRKFFKNLGF